MKIDTINIQTNNGTLFGNVINNYQPSSHLTHQPQKIEEAEIVEEKKVVKPTQPTAEIDPSSLIFKPNEQNREAIEALLKETLSISMKKSVICRKLYQQKDLYNLHQHDDTTKANIINAWLNKFGIESHFKALFSRKDFGNYYCLP